VIDAARYIGQQNLSAALQFAEAVRKTEELLAQTPGIGAPRDFSRLELAGMRLHSVQNFRKYLIFYLPKEHGIEIVRVLNGARDLSPLFDES
jgi:plasmid stabilization system protein ParE